MWCYAWQAHFLKIMFCPQNGDNRPSPGFFECIGKFRFFFSVLYFLINLVYNESLYSCMLKEISYLGKFWLFRYGQKCSWPVRLRDISINRRTLKLAVSDKEVNEINWFLVCLSNSFLRNGWLGFSDFLHNGRLVEYWKADSPFFQENSFLSQIWAKGPRMGPK